MTVKEWAGQSGINPDTARRTVSRKSGRTVGQLDSLTADEWQMWKPGKSGQDKTKTRPTPKPQKNSVLPDVSTPPAVDVPPVGNVEPEQPAGLTVWERLREILWNLLCPAIVLGHGVLIWYDCATLWNTAGAISGGISFGVVLLAVIVATDETKPRTSETAMWAVALIDLAAWWVHYPVFMQESAQDLALVTGFACGFICFFSFIALYLFRDSKII